VLERLLGEMPVATFVEGVFLRQPFSRPHGADALCPLGTWETIERILDRPGAPAAPGDHVEAVEPDVVVCRQGQRWAGTHTPSYAEARRLFADGYTLLIRHAERHDPALAGLAKDFARDLGGAVDVHIYCTPAGQHGFGWHYDAEDVFILQTAGRKEYSLRKNTVNPWPLVETLPADMQFEREQMPLLKCPLAAGDWLYIPNGYWHVACSEEDSISLAVGVLMPAALDAFDSLRCRLLESLLWRQRLPVGGEAAPLESAELLERYREVFAALGDDLARTFRDEAFVRSYLLSRGVLLDNC
jgi:50S ribosomal protein L16 3-hydroxylase